MHRSLTAFIAAALCGAHPHAAAADEEAVTVSALRNPVDKSYRRMLSGAELFAQRRGELAPAAALRFKLLPRRPGTRMDDIELELVGDSFATPLPVAHDGTFELPADAAALKERASVRPNRRAGSMTWRAEVRTPGLPADVRRLGDLRLECEVGMRAGLISNYRPVLFRWLDERLADSPEYCRRAVPRYLFFADRALWSVTLVAGTRREVLSVDLLYGGASRDPDWKADLPYCDCEVLMDRAFFLPLGDRSWPDDALVHFEYMDDTP